MCTANRDLFNQVYVAGDKLVRVRVCCRQPEVVYGADYQGVSAYQFASMGSSTYKRLRGWWYRFAGDGPVYVEFGI